MDFSAEVYPVVLKYANQRLKDEERVSTALVLSWWLWKNRTSDFPPSIFAQIAVRRVLAGRDFPGCGTSKRDALTHSVQGAGMGLMRDRRPGPARMAESKDWFKHWARRLPWSLLVFVFNAHWDWVLPGKALAEMQHVSEGRISQMRSECRELWAEEE